MKRLIPLILSLLVITLPACTKQKEEERPHLKVGLVLGGGGAKGAAEIGVLKYIEQAGIPIDYVVGTSIGSIVGGLYCSGVSVEEMDSLFRSQEWLSLFTNRNSRYSSQLFAKENGIDYLFGFVLNDSNKKERDVLDGPGLLHGDSIVSLFTRATGHSEPISFDDLKIPFRCVACDAKTMKEVVFSKGNLPLCMRTSMAIPVVFSPIKMDSMLLIDGGALNNLPVDVCKQMGAEVIIAIDLSQDAEEKKEKKNGWLGELLEDVDLGEHINWLTHRPDNKKYRENLKMVDVYINPDLHEFNVSSFKKKSIETMIQRGEKAGKAAMKKLQALKKRIYEIPSEEQK